VDGTVGFEGLRTVQYAATIVQSIIDGLVVGSTVKYLRGAWMVADGNPDLAVRFYARGYYYDAKHKGLLDETGLGRDRVRRRRA
jgi:hypothetical protein